MCCCDCDHGRHRELHRTPMTRPAAQKFSQAGRESESNAESLRQRAAQCFNDRSPLRADGHRTPTTGPAEQKFSQAGCESESHAESLRQRAAQCFNDRSPLRADDRDPWHPSAAGWDPRSTAAACPRSRCYPGRTPLRAAHLHALTIGLVGTPGTPRRRAATIAARPQPAPTPDATPGAAEMCLSAARGKFPELNFSCLAGISPRS